jgi:hypothetical protein
MVLSKEKDMYAGGGTPMVAKGWLSHPLLLLLLLFQFYCFIILNYFLKIFILFIYLFYIVPHVNLSG